MPSGDMKPPKVPVWKNMLESHLRGNLCEKLRSVVTIIIAEAEDQKPQSACNGANQGTLEVEDDKIQRYLSRLQLAADLLLLIQQEQQEQQQSSNQEGQGSATSKQDFYQLGYDIFAEAVRLVLTQVLLPKKGSTLNPITSLYQLAA